MTITGLIIGGIFAVAGWLVSSMLKSKFTKYSKVPTNGGLTGRDVAERMLADSKVYGVKIHSVEGSLTDHYNPINKTVNLSKDVYYGNSIAAAAVSAHECGHAIQHATAYSWLTMRSKLVPAVSISSKYMTWVLLAGIILIETFPILLLAGICMYAVTTLFSFVTLPVEIDASKRAMKWLENAGITTYNTYPQAQSALRWAAYTYVVSALGSLAMLVHYIMLYLARRN
jgi:Zn-dependent membrane protease YugP